MSDKLIGEVFGCLEILDEGMDYEQFVDDKIKCIEDEKKEFIDAINNKKLKLSKKIGWMSDEPDLSSFYSYIPINFDSSYEYVNLSDFDMAINDLKKQRGFIHYKCRCRKCGKIRYYRYATLEHKPRYCFRPEYCSDNCGYAVKAQDGNYRKLSKYSDDESVCLIHDRDLVVPSEKYCGKWNDNQEKVLKKKAQNDAEIIKNLPRVYGENYDCSFEGTKYESLEIIECINDTFEILPDLDYARRHHQHYGNVMVLKQYRCRCYLCEKEKIVTCDMFGIFPPTKYGSRAYDGYWSKVYCDCHKISSFQWIVNDILIKNNVDYLVEVSVDNLCGIDNCTPLRFDFAVYKEGKLFAYIECQGEQHYMPVEKFGGELQLKIQQKNDNIKREYVKNNNITLIEISYKHKKYDKVVSILKEHNII